jgi:hypothetical protein
MILFCPKCEHGSDTTTAIGGDVVPPKEGDAVVCRSCGVLSFVLDASTGRCRPAKDREEFDGAVIQMLELLPNSLVSTALIEVDRRAHTVHVYVNHD